MSLRVKKALGIRRDVSKVDPKRKFIFAFEGEKTEKQYFTALGDCKNELGISDIVEIEPLERTDPSRSNQLQVVNEVKEYLDNIIDCQTSCEEIKNHLRSIIYENNMVELDNIINLIDSNFKDNNYMKNLENFTVDLKKLLENNPELGDFIYKLKNFSISMEYEKDFDSVCIILDRDKESFTQSQYDLVLDICKDNKYKLGVTNPCFEFWLLLHLTDCKEYDVEDVINNKKTSKNGKTFIERCLTEKLGSYNKRRLKFQPFKDKIKIAIENEKLYAEDVQELKYNIGSSIGLILKEIL